ncbi:hypothetical protein POV27_13995 [Aureisphaera galaxeae]|uniref:hypothetical protein n=1 Tax=Aureisphaera galaxeae TaxID=1538023 RepID=UPI0023503884|nr:hypothetical protein [Aureisphaera galaxeae]MDC8005169.1 hypothetical protein [Aureisphaera galaxeae]
MKKKLRSQIKDLATQILSENSENNTRKMKQLARELFEKLTVLEYVEVQLLGDVDEEAEEQSLDSKSYRENNWFKEPEPVPQPEHKEELVEPAIEKIKDIVAQMPEETQSVDALLEEVLPKKEFNKNDLEEFASSYQEMPVFERKEENNVATEVKLTIETTTEEEPEPEMELEEKVTANDVERPKSINDAVGKGLQIGLNDRLAFVKHLFDGKSEDYTRVLSQISTFGTFEEAETFIKGKVKPDYNYWLHKDDVSKRFMKIVEQSFN